MSSHGIFRPPPPQNEPVKGYEPGSPEREELRRRLEEMQSERIEIPLVIGGKDVSTGETFESVMPHAKSHVLADVHSGGPEHVQQAIDAACELIDFWYFNVQYMTRIYEEQPVSSRGTWNRMEYRPLEGFVFAVSPFNFTAISGNLPTSPAMMGNTVVWKPASTAAYSAYFLMRLLQEAGLPDGVINLVYGSGATIGDAALASSELAGIHFTGSTGVFNSMWKTVGTNVGSYRGYPRIVGETGGKDFIVAHPSADVDAVATAILRGSFEYQGQKCS